MFKAEEKKKKGKREEVEGEVWFVVKMVWIVIGRPARDPRHPPTRSTGGRAEGSHDLSMVDACASVQDVPCQAPVRPPLRSTRSIRRSRRRRRRVDVRSIFHPTARKTTRNEMLCMFATTY
jgi:hypothetical protein